MPKVSIILTSYNYEKYLGEAIESALGQTFSDFELIIWDDCSTDRSWSIVAGYSDPRIRSFRNREHKRGVYGINKAISEVATGEYIAIHHSDDVWQLDKLERQVAHLDKHHEVGAVFTNAKIIKESGGPLLDTRHSYSTIFDQPNRSRHEWLRYFFLFGNALCHPSVLIRKECYSNCGLYRYGFGQLADFDMWVRLCLKYEIHVLAEKFVNFRVRDDNLNTSADTPPMRARHAFERLHIWPHYADIDSIADIAQIFPESDKYLQNEGADIEFSLAMTMLDISTAAPSKLFALNLILGKLADKSHRDRIATVHNFKLQDFVGLVGQQDPMQILRIEELNGALSEKDLQLAELSGALSERDLQLAELSGAVSERDLQLAELSGALSEKDLQLSELSGALSEKDLQLEEKETHVQAILKSQSWRLTAPIRAVCDLWTTLRGLFSRGAQ